MAYFSVQNTTPGLENRPVGQDLFYPVPDDATCVSARALFLSDSQREGKLLFSLPPPAVGKLWTRLACTLSSSPPTSTPPGGLEFLTPSLNCATGQLTLATRGGNGTTVEYMAVGLQSWSTNNVMTVPPWQRSGTNFKLQARQGTTVITMDYATACPVSSAPPASSLPPATSSTPPATSTPPTTYLRVGLVGNSILQHGPAPSLGWNANRGMAASADDKDMLSLLRTHFVSRNSSAQVVPIQANTWEATYPSNDLSGFASYRTEPLDLLIIRLGENVNDGDVFTNKNLFKQKYVAMIDYILNGKPIPVVLTTSVWSKPQTSQAIREIAQERNYRLVELANMWTFQNDSNNPYFAFGQYTEQAVANHPNDAGMAEIVNRIIAQLPSGGSGTNTTPTGNDFFGFTFTPILSGTAPSDGKIVLQNSRIKVIRDLAYGGGITHVSENGGLNMVNNFDHGRQLEIALHSGPKPYDPTPASYPKPAPPHPFYQFGYNPNTVGDYDGVLSPVVAYGFDSATGTHYIKTRARNFPTKNYLTGVYFERWMRLVGTNVVRNWYKITVDRSQDAEPVRNPDNSLKKFPASAQEFPILYGNDAILNRTIYPGASKAVQIVDHGTTTSVNDYGNIPTSECWVGALNSASGRGMAMVGPDIWEANGRVDEASGAGGEYGIRSIYTAGGKLLNLDPVGVIYTCFDVVVGTPTDFSAAAAAHRRNTYANNVPDYRFDSKRHDFASLNALLSDDNTGGELLVTIQKNNVQIETPARTFNAADMPVLYIRMRNDSDSNNLLLGWIKPGQTDGDRFVGGEQRTAFTCPRDGAYHTIAITMTGKYRWTDQISKLMISYGVDTAPDPDLPNENEVTGSKFWRLKYFGKNNPDV